ncbi:MAG: tol-pal system protein YbgF [Desulfovibrio sp.]|uniref:tol-pal system protein YbgF n=1 Tax=Desulfovibrio sp. 7SRBS1 TaxID=3378064 RepID=UPI003B3EF9B2
MNKVFPFVLLGSLLLVLSGCANKQSASPDSDAWRLQSLEENFLNFKEKQRASEERLRRQSDDMAARIDHLEVTIQALHMEMQTRLDEAAMNKNVMVQPTSEDEPAQPVSTQGGDTPFTGAPAPAVSSARDSAIPANANAEQLYHRGQALVSAEKYEEGREVLNEFLGKNKQNPLVPNALYWLGESYYGEKRFAQAILTFKDVTQDYPKHHKAAAALLKIGYSYDKLGDAANARFYLQALLDEYPTSDPARLARQKLKTLGQ